MTERPAYSLAQLTLYFMKLGSIGFGGPVALVGYMYRDLVEARHWISEEDYKEGLTLAQLMPGPLAAQLAMYLGYVHYRIVGATVAGVAFVLPSFLMVVAIGWARSEEHTSELQSQSNLVCRLLLEKKKKNTSH